MSRYTSAPDHSPPTNLRALSSALHGLNLPHENEADRIVFPLPVRILDRTWLAPTWLFSQPRGGVLTAPLAVADVSDLPLALEIANAWNAHVPEPKAYVVRRENECVVDGQVVLPMPLSADFAIAVASVLAPLFSLVVELSSGIFRPVWMPIDTIMATLEEAWSHYTQVRSEM